MTAVPAPVEIRPAWRRLGLTTALAIGYAAAGLVSLSFSLPGEPVSLLWLPSGVSLAALTLISLRLWPGIVLGAGLLAVTVSLLPENSAQLSQPGPAAIAVFFTAAPLEALAGAWLLRGPLRFHPSMERLRDALALVAASSAAAAVGAAFGAAGLVLARNAPPSAMSDIFLKWWLGDVSGMVLIAPFVLTWRAGVWSRRMWQRSPEFLALAVSFLLFCGTYFGGLLGSGPDAPKLLFLTFPFAVWAGLSFGPRGSAVVCVILALAAAQGVALERGPFAGPDHRADLFNFGLFVVVTAGCSALFAALMAERRRAGAQLLASERHQQRILGQVPAVVWTTDRDLRFTSSRGAALGPLGLKPDQVVGVTLWEYFGTTDPTLPAIAAHLRVLDGESASYVTSWQERTFTSQLEPLVDSAGLVEGVVGVAVDVTEREAAEQALTETREQVTSLVQSVKAVLWRADAATFRFTFVSNEAEALLGYPVERWTTEPTFWRDHIHPEDRDHAVAFCASQTRGLADHAFEYRMVASDGRVVWVRDVVRVRVDGGRPMELLGAMIDITAEKTAQQERQAEEERYRALVEHATLGMYRSDSNGRFVWVNPALAAMLGYQSPHELEGSDVASTAFRNPADRQALVERFGPAARVSAVEVHWRRKDGSPITLNLSGRGIQDAQGRFDGYEMVAEDITRRKTLEDQLRQSQKMEALGQLTGGMAHDFNNLLTVVLSNAELAAADPMTAEQRVALEDLTKAAGRGAALIRKLLGFSRRDLLAPEPLDVGATVSETAKTLRRLLPETIGIEVAVAAGLPPVRADAGAVWQILLNLATNSRDAMPGGGRLSLSAARTSLAQEQCVARGWGMPGSYVSVTVSDTGEGMDEETRRHAFEPFFTTKAPGKGSGLGLSMVYGLVKQQNGYVEVSSNPGQGTEVTILFPPTDGLVAATRQRPATGTSGHETILVVEDEEALRRLAARALEKMGYKVLLAADGVEGLEAFGRNPDDIALVLTDVVMPRMGGKELVEGIRSRGGRPRVLFTSGYTTRADRSSGDLDPGAAFLPKPWTIGELASKVREVLDS